MNPLSNHADYGPIERQGKDAKHCRVRGRCGEEHKPSNRTAKNGCNGAAQNSAEQRGQQDCDGIERQWRRSAHPGHQVATNQRRDDGRCQGESDAIRPPPLPNSSVGSGRSRDAGTRLRRPGSRGSRHSLLGGHGSRYRLTRMWASQEIKVREKGVEPLHLTVLDPKSSASANSATLAFRPGQVVPKNNHRILVEIASGANRAGVGERAAFYKIFHALLRRPIFADRRADIAAERQREFALVPLLHGRVAGSDLLPQRAIVAQSPSPLGNPCHRPFDGDKSEADDSGLIAGMSASIAGRGTTFAFQTPRRPFGAFAPAVSSRCGLERAQRNSFPSSGRHEHCRTTSSLRSR